MKLNVMGSEKRGKSENHRTSKVQLQMKEWFFQTLTHHLPRSRWYGNFAMQVLDVYSAFR